jgi:hypothetical protein
MLVLKVVFVLLEELKSKVNELKGKKATTTAFPELFGKFGVIEWVQIDSTGNIDKPFKISYLINYDDFNVLSPEEHTVILEG